MHRIVLPGNKQQQKCLSGLFLFKVEKK
jgi:hypothetical protein